MQKTEFTACGRECTAFACDAPEFLLLQPADEHDFGVLESEAAFIKAEAPAPFLLAAFRVKSWNDELSPWPAPPAFGDESFGDGAEATLALAEERLIPELAGRFGLPEDIPVIIGGYSLAALFALWSVYRTDRFAAAAAASPSVWFPGWTEFASGRAPRTGHVYRSLGEREERTKNSRMSRVGECIRRQYGLLGSAGTDCVLEWNAGNHFREPDRRTAKGFAWCVRRLAEERGHV